MRQRAFTLMELMLVTAVFATLSLAIFTCLSNGIKLWERGKQLVAEEDVALFFDRFSSDVHNAFSYSGISFEGEEYRFSFPTMVWTPADRVSARAEEGLVDQIGRVSYAYDPARGMLTRTQANYAQALKEQWGPEEVIVPRVGTLRFRYFYGTAKDGRMSTGQGEIPSGIEVELTVLQGFVQAGAAEKVFKRYIALPAGV